MAVPPAAPPQRPAEVPREAPSGTGRRRSCVKRTGTRAESYLTEFQRDTALAASDNQTGSSPAEFSAASARNSRESEPRLDRRSGAGYTPPHPIPAVHVVVVNRHSLLEILRSP